METLLSNIKIEIPAGIYIKDPETSGLGKRIIENIWFVTTHKTSSNIYECIL